MTRPGPGTLSDGTVLDRTAFLGTLTDLLEQRRLVALVGPQGSGRTTLARAVLRFKETRIPCFSATGATLGRRYLKGTELEPLLDLPLSEPAFLLLDDLDRVLLYRERRAFMALLDLNRQRLGLQVILVCHEFDWNYLYEEFFGANLLDPEVVKPLNLSYHELHLCPPFVKRLDSECLNNPYALSVALSIDWDAVEGGGKLRTQLLKQAKADPSFQHHCLEEWSALRGLDQLHKDSDGDTLAFARNLSPERDERKAFRYWLKELCQRDDELLSVYFMCSLRLTELPKHFVHDVLDVLVQESELDRFLEENRFELLGGHEPPVLRLCEYILTGRPAPTCELMVQEFLDRYRHLVDKDFASRFRKNREKREDTFWPRPRSEVTTTQEEVTREEPEPLKHLRWAFAAIHKRLEPKDANRWEIELAVIRELLESWQPGSEIEQSESCYLGLTMLVCLRDHPCELKREEKTLFLSVLRKSLEADADGWGAAKVEARFEAGVDRQVARALGQLIRDANEEQYRDSLVAMLPIALTHPNQEVRELLCKGFDGSQHPKDELWNHCLRASVALGKLARAYGRKEAAELVRPHFWELSDVDDEIRMEELAPDARELVSLLQGVHYLEEPPSPQDTRLDPPLTLTTRTTELQVEIALSRFHHTGGRKVLEHWVTVLSYSKELYSVTSVRRSILEKVLEILYWKDPKAPTWTVLIDGYGAAAEFLEQVWEIPEKLLEICDVLDFQAGSRRLFPEALTEQIVAMQNYERLGFRLPGPILASLTEALAHHMRCQVASLKDEGGAPVPEVLWALERLLEYSPRAVDLYGDYICTHKGA